MTCSLVLALIALGIAQSALFPWFNMPIARAKATPCVALGDEMKEKDRLVASWKCVLCNIRNETPFCAKCGYHQRTVEDALR